jgi:BirA family biotin operon repressor/biotin-[acetyl-CoA-carboxylase] ligase
MKPFPGYLDVPELAKLLYYVEVSSTNDLALEWAENGAADGSLVLADLQTAGRGRAERRWVTRPGTALAMSLILRPKAAEAAHVARFTALAALGLVDALAKLGLAAAIKWPNDVLLNGKKVAGVLVETIWRENDLRALVVGMGVNVTAESVPPEAELRYPATAVEAELGEAVDRWALLAGILQGLFKYRAILPTDAFLTAWNEKLAFRGQQVAFQFPDGQIRPAQVASVQPDGRLALQLADETEPRLVAAGEVTMVDRGGALKD